MKRLCYLLILMLATVSSLSAQRRVDLALNLLYPTPQDSVLTGRSFNLKVSVKNVGVTDFDAQDTMLVYLLYNTDTLPIIGPVFTRPYLTATGQLFKPNDSIVLDYYTSFGFALGGSTVRVCGIVVPKAGPGRTAMVDENEEDNKDCANVYVKRDPNNVPAINGSTATAVLFPNPAQGVAHIAFQLTRPEVVMVTVKDVTGRTVASVAGRRYQQGDQQVPLSVSHLSPGLYSFHVQGTAFKAAGKFMVQ